MRTRALVLVLLLAAFAISGAPGERPVKHHHKPTHTRKADPKALRSDLKSIKDRKRAAVHQLNKTRKQVRNVRGDIREVDGRLEGLETELGVTQDRLARSRVEQKKLTSSLQSATVRLKVTRERARRRIRELYMQGDGTVVAAFSGSSTYSEFLSRRFVFERIAKRDRDLFEEYQRLRNEVADRKTRADRLVVRIGGLIRDKRQQQSELEDTRAEKGELLGQLRGKQQSLERMVQELDEEENSIEAEIASYNRGPGRHSNLAPFRGRFSRPVAGPITSRFGRRFHPILKVWRLHAGVDMGARRGTPIVAAADGIVIFAGYGRGYGNKVILDHGGGISTLYGHCSRLFVRGGQRVRRGERIAAVGSTGLSTGPHLHFEVRKNGKAVNPLGWL